LLAIIYTHKKNSYYYKNIIDRRLIDYLVLNLKKMNINNVILASNYEIRSSYDISYAKTNELDFNNINDSHVIFISMDSLLFDDIILKKMVNYFLDNNKRIIKDKAKKIYIVDKNILNKENLNIDLYLNYLFTTTKKKQKKELKLEILSIDNIKSNNDFLLLEADLKNKIILEHINNGTYIENPSSVTIGIDVKIADNASILSGSKIIGTSHIGNEAIIGPNSFIIDSKIHNNAYVMESKITDSIIGDNAYIGPYSQIRNESVIGSNVRIGNFVEVKKSIIGDNTKVSHLAYIGDADIGKNVNFGCGAITVNYNGKTKNKTIIEDNAFIGCNTNLIAPITISKRTFIAAGSTITSSTNPNDFAISRAIETIKNNYSQKYIGN